MRDGWIPSSAVSRSPRHPRVWRRPSSPARHASTTRPPPPSAIGRGSPLPQLGAIDSPGRRRLQALRSASGPRYTECSPARRPSISLPHGSGGRPPLSKSLMPALPSSFSPQASFSTSQASSPPSTATTRSTRPCPGKAHPKPAGQRVGVAVPGHPRERDPHRKRALPPPGSETQTGHAFWPPAPNPHRRHPWPPKRPPTMTIEISMRPDDNAG